MTNLKKYSGDQIRDVVEQVELNDQEFKNALLEVVWSNREVFSDQPGRTCSYEHEIHLKGQTPFCIKSYPIPNVYKNAVRDQVNEMIQWGAFKEAPTDYVSLLITVAKKDKSVSLDDLSFSYWQISIR